MRELVEFLKNEFPDDAMEIQEGLDLLNQCIGGSVSSIKEAFNSAIDERDYKKLDLLKEMLEKVDNTQNELEKYSDMLELEDNIEEVIVKKEMSMIKDRQLPDYDAYRVDNNMPHTLHEDYTHKRPVGFELQGKRYDSKDWRDVLVQTCGILAKKDFKSFNSFVNDKTMQGRKVAYFSKDTVGLRRPKGVPGTDIYVMTNMSANQIRNVIEKMLRKYNIKTNDYKIYLRADYTSIPR